MSVIIVAYQSHHFTHRSISMSHVTLYSTPGCQQCRATAAEFERKKIAYTYVDASTDPASAEWLRSQGVSSMPAVSVDGTIMWTGYRPDRIDELTREISYAA